MLVIDAIANAATSIFGIIDKFVPDKDLAAKMQNEINIKLIDTQAQLQQGQIDINKIEAASTNVFVSGWRPAIGWVCAFALFWQFVGYDMSLWLIAVTKSTLVAPRLMGGENLMELVLAMLGLAGFRTFEKSKGIASK
jgi:hypothetical protein